jgi:hypothetical protein
VNLDFIVEINNVRRLYEVPFDTSSIPHRDANLEVTTSTPWFVEVIIAIIAIVVAGLANSWRIEVSGARDHAM